MGTYFTNGATRDDIVKEILDDLKPEWYHAFHAWDYETQKPINPPIKDEHKVMRRLEHKLVGTNLWVLFEIIEKGRREVTVLLYKLEVSRGSWGYKPMDESMGPYYFDCPKDWAPKLTAAPSEYARSWRIQTFGYDPERQPTLTLASSSENRDYGGAFDGFTVTSDADGGL